MDAHGRKMKAGTWKFADLSISGLCILVHRPRPRIKKLGLQMDWDGRK